MGTGGDEVVHRLAWISPGDQALADEHGVRAGVRVGDEVVWPAHPALGHPHAGVRDGWGDPGEVVAVDGQGAQVAHVDPDEPGARVEGPGHLVEVVHLHERVPSNLRAWAASHLGQGRAAAPGRRPRTNLAPIATAVGFSVTEGPFRQRLLFERVMAPLVPLSARRDLKPPAFLHLDPAQRFPRVSVRGAEADARQLSMPEMTCVALIVWPFTSGVTVTFTLAVPPAALPMSAAPS